MVYMQDDWNLQVDISRKAVHRASGVLSISAAAFRCVPMYFFMLAIEPALTS